MAALPYHYENHHETTSRRKPQQRRRGGAGSHLKVLREEPLLPDETLPTARELLETLPRHPASQRAPSGVTEAPVPVSALLSPPTRRAPSPRPRPCAGPTTRRGPSAERIYEPPPVRLRALMPPPRFDWVGLDELGPSKKAASCAAPVRAASVLPVRRAASTGRQGLRRCLAGIASLAAVVGVWFGASSLVGLRPAPSAGQAVAGASLVTGHSYVARPGDTLWSIALRFDPTGDPRPIVAELAAQLQGGVLQPGDRLVIP